MNNSDNPRGSAPNPAGAAPLRPAKNHPLKKNRFGSVVSLPLVGSEQCSINRKKTLACLEGSAVEQIQILSTVTLAGFEVIMHGRF